MSIAPELETAVQCIETLPVDEQRRIAAALIDIVERSTADNVSEETKQRLLEAKLEASEQDRLAGRLIPMEDVFDNLRKMVLSRDG